MGLYKFLQPTGFLCSFLASLIRHFVVVIAYFNCITNAIVIFRVTTHPGFHL